MPDSPSSAEHIRAHLERVVTLHQSASELGLSEAVLAVKQLQGRRFRGTYDDMLHDPGMAGAVRFFLEELYGSRDYSERDRQFSRIAGAIEKLFPQDVGQLASDLAELHALTESLDLTLAGHWHRQGIQLPEARRYLAAWRLTGQPDTRRQQLQVVQHLGTELRRLTRSKPLRIALRMMRRPAEAAGLGALQQFLEQGFDAFARLDDAQAFMACIQEREAGWLDVLDHAPADKACAMLDGVLAAASEAD